MFAVAAGLALAVLLNASIADAALTGPWVRAQAGGYTMCGISEITLHAPYMEAFGTTANRSGTSCWTGAVAATVRVKVQVYGNAGLGYTTCGPMGNDGYIADPDGYYTDGSPDFWCQVDADYLSASTHGGYISGVEYPVTGPYGYPLLSPAEYHDY